MNGANLGQGSGQGRAQVLVDVDAGQRRATLGSGIAGTIAVALLLIVLSRSLDNAWLFLLGCLVAGVVVTSVATRPRLDALVVALDAPVRAVAGSDVEHVVAVRNSGRRVASAVSVAVSAPGFSSATAVLPSLAPGASASVTVPRTATVRCASAEHCVRLVGRDVFGLLSTSRHVHVPFELLVHPAPVSVAALPSVAPRGAGVDVAGIRPFRSGDAASSVHWRASARRGDLVVLEREPEDVPRLVFVLAGPQAPGAAEPGAPEWESLVSAVGSFVRREAGGRDVAVVWAPSSADPSGAVASVGVSSPASLVELLDALARLQVPGVPPAAALEQARRWAGAGGQVLVARLDAGVPVLEPVGAR